MIAHHRWCREKAHMDVIRVFVEMYDRRRVFLRKMTDPDMKQ